MKKALYTVTPGRSGTVYLTELLRRNMKDAVVFHERTGFPHLGVNTPDASHATTFNHVGNVEHVKAFWRQKLLRDAHEQATWLIDVSHFLAKAGLVENLEFLLPHRDVALVLLQRDPFSVVWSYINRFEFVNNGFTWLFTLDANYPRRIIDSAEFVKQGMFGISIWYVNEVYARQAYYRHLLAGKKGVHIILVDLEDISSAKGAATFLRAVTGFDYQSVTVDIPPPLNATSQIHFKDVEGNARQLFEQLWTDPDQAAEVYFESGQRLGAPMAGYETRV